MNIKQKILSLSVFSFVLTMTGCGVTSQDKGTGEAGAGAVSGVAIDGYVAFAVVYVDTNENNKLDVWETRALTDGQGYFTYNPHNAEGSRNYCELEKTHKDYKHCLKIPAGYDEVMIRMTQGYDLTTVEPFTGTLSMRVSSNAENLENVIVGTPITGLLAEMDSTQKTNFYNLETDLDTSISGLDFLDFTTADLMTNEQRAILLTVALRIHKIADSMAGVLDAALDQALIADATATADGGFFNVKAGIPTDASIYVYQAFAESITASKGLSANLTSQTEMEGIVTNAWGKMKAVISEYNADPDNASSQYQIPATDPDYTAIATNMVSLADVIGTVFTAPLEATGTYTDSEGATQTYTIADDVKSRIRAVDIVASLIRDRAAAAAIANAIDLASTAADAADYLSNLKSAKVDLAGLKKKFKDAANADPVETLDATAANYDARKSFAELFGDTTSVTGLTGADGGAANEEGFAGNSLNMGEGDDSVGIAFDGATDDATSGTMKIDASFATGDFASEDGSPTELEGTWEQLDEYTMLMNVEVAGVVQPVIVKPTLDDQGNPAYYYDMGGEQQVWTPPSESNP